MTLCKRCSLPESDPVHMTNTPRVGLATGAQHIFEPAPDVQGEQVAEPHEAQCPKCGHKFFHKIGDAFKEIGESIGDAIGEAKFDGDS